VKHDVSLTYWRRGFHKVGRGFQNSKHFARDLWHGLRTEIRPLEAIPSPVVDMTQRDPVAAIMAAPEFRQTAEWFVRQTWLDRSLTSACSQALLYALARNLKPARAFEVGTYLAGASEAICRGMLANGGGTLYTADPYGLPRAPAILMKWPAPLRAHIRYYPKDSMGFFLHMELSKSVSDLTFIDGRHEYEFALFDLLASARSLAPGGFIVLDDISQAGPFFALQDFLRVNPGWVECGKPVGSFTTSDPLDRTRIAVAGTDFAVVRAPQHVFVGSRPRSGGIQKAYLGRVDGVALSIVAAPARGTLVVQCALRGHGRVTAEIIATARHEIERAGSMKIAFDRPLVLDGAYEHMTVEPWLAWNGEQPLRLSSPPTVF
jgi:predicted O-methyltransferase YrrM